MAYGKDTEVAFERSIAEIVGLVRKAGAARIAQMEERDRFTLSFAIGDRAVRFRVPFPTPADVKEQCGPRQETPCRAARRAGERAPAGKDAVGRLVA